MKEGKQSFFEKKDQKTFALGAVALGMMLPHAACAHIVGARLGDFYAGALHPMTDPLDVVLWVGLGILAGSLGANRARWLVLLFPVGLLAGLLLGLHTGIGPTGALADAALLIATGLLMAAALPLPLWVLCSAALALAVLRGLANSAGAVQQTNLVLFTAGLCTAGYAVVTLSMAATASFCAPAAGRPGWRSVAIRAVGSWIAAIGLMMGGFALS